MKHYNPELVQTNPEYALLVYRSSLSAMDLEYCLCFAPGAALYYCDSLNLTREQVFQCCILDPTAALKTNRVSGLGTELLDYCIRKDPAQAIRQSASRPGDFELTEEQYYRCALAAPKVALEFASSEMFQRMFYRCARTLAEIDTQASSSNPINQD